MATTAGELKTVKTVIGYAGHARLMAVLGEGIGYVCRLGVRTPYTHSPTHRVYEYRGRQVVCLETAHRRYEVIAVPAGCAVHRVEKDALAEFVALQKAETAAV